MKILILAGVPPCHEHTGGLVVESLIRFLPPEQVAFCAVVNPALKIKIPPFFEKTPKLILKRPRENALSVLPKPFEMISAYSFELIQEFYVKYKLAPQIAAFAKKNKINALWVVLEGQTMIRLAKYLSNILSIPLYTQVWDPFVLWLRANNIDRFTKRKLLAEFDRVIMHSTSCATASWTMSEKYTETYNIKNKPIIPGLDINLARIPATNIHKREEFIIGIAGQIYAVDEWNTLVQTLNEVNWKIANRKIRLRILSGSFVSSAHRPVNFEYYGWQTQEETLRLLNECDLLYLPYWFSEIYTQESTYCFPSKLVTYFAAGRPVLCHAPSYSSPAKYLKKHEAGFLCDSMDTKNVYKSIENVICDTDSYAKVTINGNICFKRDFTLESMRDSFFHLLDYKQGVK